MNQRKYKSVVPDYINKVENGEKFFIDAIYNNMGVATTEFFIKVLPHLKEEFWSSATELGRINYVTPGAAIYHLRRLEKKEYVHRDSYRAWSLGERFWELEKVYRDETT